MRSFFLFFLLVIHFHNETLSAQCHETGGARSSNYEEDDHSIKDQNAEEETQQDPINSFLTPIIDETDLSMLFLGKHELNGQKWSFVFAQDSVEVAHSIAEFTRQKKKYYIDVADKYCYPPGSNLFTELKNRHKNKRTYCYLLDDNSELLLENDEFVEIIKPYNKIYCDFFIYEIGAREEEKLRFTLFRKATQEEIAIFNPLYEDYLIKMIESKSIKQLSKDAEVRAEKELTLHLLTKLEANTQNNVQSSTRLNSLFFGVGVLVGGGIIGALWAKNSN